MPTSRVNINPDTLAFARERAGYPVDRIAEKMQVKEDQWQQWERGEKKPTTNQLITLAKYLDRTPAFFYLKEVPEEEAPLSEFRTINNRLLLEASPKLIKAIREAKRNREIILELYQNQGKKLAEIPSIKPDDSDISSLAKEIRSWLEVPLKEQKRWSGLSTALTRWKGVLENKDIHVVQYPYVEVSESRGFTLAESTLPIIGINSKDSSNAWIFTLIHELIHVLLRDSVMINDELTEYFPNGQRNIEQFCNRLAAEILVPSDDLREVFDAETEPVKEIRGLSRTYGVSTYVILIRLKTEKLISEQVYEGCLSEVSFYGQARQSDGGDPYYTRIVQKGRLFMLTAFESYFQEQITLGELANITGWKVPNLDELAAKTFGWPEEGNLRLRYSLDSDAIIQAWRDYPIAFFPKVWESLHQLAKNGIAGIAPVTYGELEQGGDELFDWVKERKDDFVAENSDELQDAVAYLVNHYNNFGLTTGKNEGDPYVVALAMI